MATKQACICFQFKTLDDIIHDPALEYDFCKEPPLPGEALQPVVVEAVARIKRSLAASVSSWLHFGKTQTSNISNFLHVALLTFNTEIEHADGRAGQTSVVCAAKFYHMGAEDVYHVSLDIEHMYSSLVEPHDELAYRLGMPDGHIDQLVRLLDAEFELGGHIERQPLVERGRRLFESPSGEPPAVA